MKIRQLELRLQEEEHQRKLVQDKTSQVTKGALHAVHVEKGFDQLSFSIIVSLLRVVTAAVGRRGQQDTAAGGVASPGQETSQSQAPSRGKDLLLTTHSSYS